MQQVFGAVAEELSFLNSANIVTKLLDFNLGACLLFILFYFISFVFIYFCLSVYFWRYSEMFDQQVLLHFSQ